MTVGNLRIPGWFLVVVGLLAGVISAATATGIKIGQRDSFEQVVNARLCRIERALNVPPWESCYR